jgi:hypothetical protein
MEFPWRKDDYTPTVTEMFYARPPEPVPTNNRRLTEVLVGGLVVVALLILAAYLVLA